MYNKIKCNKLANWYKEIGIINARCNHEEDEDKFVLHT